MRTIALGAVLGGDKPPWDSTMFLQIVSRGRCRPTAAGGEGLEDVGDRRAGAAAGVGALEDKAAALRPDAGVIRPTPVIFWAALFMGLMKSA
jgi:hypothetical protein